MFSFQNGDGSNGDSSGGHQNETFTRYNSNSGLTVSGVLLHHHDAMQPCTFAISAKESKEVSVSSRQQ